MVFCRGSVPTSCRRVLLPGYRIHRQLVEGLLEGGDAGLEQCHLRAQEALGKTRRPALQKRAGKGGDVLGRVCAHHQQKRAGKGGDVLGRLS